MLEPAPGSFIADRYELIELIGEGGMARIWRARRLDDQREIAIKFVGAQRALDREWLRRFEREATLLTRLGRASEHVVEIFDRGVAPALGPFLVMELLQGETLATRLDARARLSIDEVVAIVSELCQALGAAHTAGVIHRDVKPSNIFLHRRGNDAPEIVKLLDFGIAKVRLDSDLTAPTRAGSFMGTPHYMSPEQFLGDAALDARSDLWSVGVVVYRALVGHTPFSRGPAAELGARVLGRDPEPPSTLVPALPPAFDRWIEKALAKRVEARFATAHELSNALAETFELVGAVRIASGRRAKGVNLIDLAKLLGNARRDGRLGELAVEDQQLLDERILVSTWYPIEKFWSLLRLAHERLLGGTDESAVELGRAGAKHVMGGVHSIYVKSQDLDGSLRSFERGWASYFDFGSVEACVTGSVLTVTILDYPDIPRVHALTTLGWFSEALALVGVEPRFAKIVEEPWNGAPDLVYEFGI